MSLSALSSTSPPITRCHFQERLEGKTGLAAEAAALEAKRMEVFGPIASG